MITYKRLFELPVFIPAFFFLVGGIIAGNFLTAPFFLFAAVLLLSVSWAFLTIKKTLYFYPACLMAGWFLIQVQTALPSDKDHIIYHLEHRGTLTGRVDSFVRDYGHCRRMVVALSSIVSKNREQAVHGRIYLNVYGKPDRNLRYDDTICFTSYLRPFRNFSNPGGFDYKTHMHRKNIWGSASVQAGQITVFPETARRPVLSTVIRKLQHYRADYVSHLTAHIGTGDEADILLALVAGKKERISPALRDRFGKSGVSHLLAISGLHLSIIAMLFYFLFKQGLYLFKPLLISGRAVRLAAAMTMIPLFLYSVMSGFSPSTQRALIMIGMVMAATVLNRDSDVVNSLAFAGILILLADSASLFSISFQLSFAAVGSILLGMSLIDHGKWNQRPVFVSRLFLFIMVSVWAGLGTLPLVIHHFGLVSTVQVAANLVMIPVVGFLVLPCGLLSLVSFTCLAPVSAGLLHIDAAVLKWCLVFIDRIITLPFTWFRTGSFSWPELILVYLMITVCVMWVRTRHRKTLFFLALLMGAVLMDAGIRVRQRFYNPELEVVALDVGQGSSAVLFLPNGKRVLVDGGGFLYGSGFDTGRYLIAPFLRQRYILTLDAVILTHPQADHMNGLVYVLENVTVKKLIKNSDHASFRAYRDLIGNAVRQKSQIIELPEEGLDLWMNRVRFRFLPLHSPGGVNDNSVVFRLDYGRFSMLFPGDIEKERESGLRLTNADDLDTDVMMAAHHGSVTSNNDFFLEKVSPESVIISCGWRNRYRFPHPDVIERFAENGASVFRTDLNGAVRVISDGYGFQITAMKEE